GLFASRVAAHSRRAEIRRVCCELFGSLALTGAGHGTPRGVVLGLCGQRPDTVDPASIAPLIDSISRSGVLTLGGCLPVPFDSGQDIVFHPDQVLPGHSNGMRFAAFDTAGAPVEGAIYYSIGGGFVVEEGAAPSAANRAPVPYPFRSAAELLDLCRAHSLT